MTLRRSKFHRVLHRPNLVLGGERELVLTVGLACATVAVTTLDWLYASISIVFWLIALSVFRLIAKYDPCWTAVFMRQIRYKDYYPARSRPSRINR